MSSTIPSSPGRSSIQASPHETHQNADDSSDAEMECLMRSSPEVPDDDNFGAADQPDSSSPFGNFGSSEDASQRSSSQAPGLPDIRPLTSGVSNLRVPLIKARRHAERLKLHPYQVEAVESFSSPFDREVQLFTQLLATANKLSDVAAAAPPFTVSPALLINIKSYVCAILLSPRLSAYRGTTARNHVFAIIARERAHVPTNFDTDVDTKKTILSAIQNELTQARSRIKKDIRASLADAEADDLTQSQHILDLAAKVVSNTEVTITVPLCACLAILRSQYRKYSAEKVYWKKVDGKLASMRNQAKGDNFRLQRAIQRLLKEDRDKYGDKSQYTLPDNSVTGNTWQRSVEDIFQAA